MMSRQSDRWVKLDLKTELPRDTYSLWRLSMSSKGRSEVVLLVLWLCHLGT